MIAYSDNTRMLLGIETSWGVATDATFNTVSFIRETITPEYRQVKLGSLNSFNRTVQPILTEEAAIGDVEVLATVHNLQTLLPLIMHDEATKLRYTLGTSYSSEEGVIYISLPLGIGEDGDFVYVTVSPAPELDGWRQMTADGGIYFTINGFEPSAYVPTGTTYEHWMLHPGKTEKSCQIYKSYRDGEEWLMLDGGMMQRLTLDLAEGELFTLTASFIGKSLKITEEAPTAETIESQPLGFSTGIKFFTLESADDDTMLVTQDNTIITACRIVIERQGMTPQYGIGNTQPRAILPGEVNVYGVLEMLIGDYKMLAWMQNQSALRLSLALEDSERNGAAFTLPKISLSGVEFTSPNEGEPLRARFRFEAAGDNAEAMIRAAIHLED